MAYIEQEQIALAREMDLLTYLRKFEPQELVHKGGNVYSTRTHDSLKISNGKWCWWSRNIGGKNALGYLTKVEGVPFLDAVQRILGAAPTLPTSPEHTAPVSKTVDWVFYNATEGDYIIGHGGGAASQHTYCTAISWADALPGDLVFYPNDTHVGIIAGWDENGNILIVHCANGYNNVVITGKEGFTSVGRPDIFL